MSFCVCVACTALREWAYPSLVAQNILIYWLAVSSPRHLPLSLFLSLPVPVIEARELETAAGTASCWKRWKRRELATQRKRHNAREGCPIWELIQQPFNQGPYIIQIYELRSWPNQNLDLSARSSIYKRLVVGSGGDLAGDSILPFGRGFPVDRAGSGAHWRKGWL